jgi:hypothetical protein
MLECCVTTLISRSRAAPRRFYFQDTFRIFVPCISDGSLQCCSNENTNGLLRQYFPKGTDLSRFSQAYLNKIALRLNQRPRPARLVVQG